MVIHWVLLGIVAYIDRRMLKSEKDTSGRMAGRLAYLTGQDIGKFSGRMLMIPRVDIACTRYVIQTMYPMTSREDSFQINNEHTGKIETSYVNENSNNIILLAAPFPNGGKKEVIDWMKDFQPKLRERINSQLIEWEEAFHVGCYVRPEMWQFLKVIKGERLKMVYQAIENQYQILLKSLDEGKKIIDHPFDKLAESTKAIALPR